MQTKVIDINCKDKEYKFNISVVSDEDWEQFVYNVVLEKGDFDKKFEINGYKVVIRDNKAKVKIFYQDNAYHELEYRLDIFGRAVNKYEDFVSVLWQDVMTKYYGEEYQKAKYVKLGREKVQTI